MSLWDSIPIPGLELELKNPSEWDFFALAGLLQPETKGTTDAV